jgi:hypothetical protein
MIVMRVAANKPGEVAEWLNALASKASVPERVSGVRIPPSPPAFRLNNLHTLIPARIARSSARLLLSIDTPPGGALVFELRQRAGSTEDEVSVYYTAQTLEQMRNAAPLTLEEPPAVARVFIPGCSKATSGFPCDWKDFARTLRSAIDPAFTR